MLLFGSRSGEPEVAPAGATTRYVALIAQKCPLSFNCETPLSVDARYSGKNQHHCRSTTVRFGVWGPRGESGSNPHRFRLWSVLPLVRVVRGRVLIRLAAGGGAASSRADEPLTGH